MKCRGCEHDLDIVRTVTAGPYEKTSEAVCPSCRRKWTLVAFVALEATERGQGPHAIATKIKNGGLTPELRRKTVEARR